MKAKYQKKMIVYTIIISLVTLGMISLLSFKKNLSHKLKLVCYDKEEKIIYIYSDENILLENVINPFWSEEYILGIYDNGVNLFIGKYSIKTEKWEELLPISQLCEGIKKEIDVWSIYNIRMQSDEMLTFIYDGKIYAYKFAENKIELLETNTVVYKYEWLDGNTLLILSEWENLQIGKLEKFNLRTGSRESINDSVTDFVCLPEENQILYSKKYFMGSWTEYELYCIDAERLEIIEKKRYRNISIGHIFLDSENDIYVIDSILSLKDKQAVRYTNRNNLISVFVTEMEGDCIGIK